MKTSPCTNGQRHKWQWVKNVNIGHFKVTARGTLGSFSLRGLYKCQCGQSKHGLFDPNGSDLRNLTGLEAKAIFGNEWDDLKGHTVVCEHCGHEFKLDEVEC